MAEIKKILYKNVNERLMVGMQQKTSFSNGAKTWQDFFQSDTIEENNVADILDSAYLLITEAIEKTSGEIDYENFY